MILLILKHWRNCPERTVVLSRRKADVLFELIRILVLVVLLCRTALVHDCLPERIRFDQPELMALRRRWWQAVTHLVAMSATAEDLTNLLQKPDLHPHWCHPVPSGVLYQTADSPGGPALWRRLSGRQACPTSLFCCRRPVRLAVTKPRNSGAGACGSRSTFAAAIALRHCQSNAQELETHFLTSAGVFSQPGLAILNLLCVPPGSCGCGSQSN